MKLNSGQSMFEVVIAIFVISLVIIGVVSASTVSLSNAVFSRNKNLAGRYSQEAIEWIRGMREQKVSDFIAAVTASPVYCLQQLTLSISGICQADVKVIDENGVDTIFKREVKFQIINPSEVSQKNVIEADVVTSWSDSKGYHEARSVTNFSDMREK